MDFQDIQLEDPIPTLPQVLDGLPPANTPAVRSVFEPGLRYQYSGGGTTISQLIVQDVTGEPYDEFMWKNVLQPLGMTNSSYTQPPSSTKQKQLASAYYADGKPVKGKYHIYPEQAAAGLWTNPTDLSKYIIETQLSMEERSSKVLKMEWARLRVTPYIDSSAALGVFIPVIGGEKYFNHNGQDEGFTAVYYGSMDGGNGVVVMCNSDDGSILNEVVNSVASVYGWKDFYKPVIKKPIAVSGANFDKYAGDYRFGTDTFSIVKENGNLTFIPKGFPASWTLVFTSEKEFFIKELTGDWTFISGVDGKIEGINWKQPNREQKAVRIQ
jgi:Beta-lactamase class C and other penicillin binding proteins